MSTSSRERTVLSLFTGAGGLDLGLEAAGFEPVLCVEVDEDSRATLKRNRPGWRLADPGDIHLLEPDGHFAASRAQILESCDCSQAAHHANRSRSRPIGPTAMVAACTTRVRTPFERMFVSSKRRSPKSSSWRTSKGSPTRTRTRASSCCGGNLPQSIGETVRSYVASGDPREHGGVRGSTDA